MCSTNPKKRKAAKQEVGDEIGYEEAAEELRDFFLRFAGHAGSSTRPRCMGRVLFLLKTYPSLCLDRWFDSRVERPRCLVSFFLEAQSDMKTILLLPKIVPGVSEDLFDSHDPYLCPLFRECGLIVDACRYKAPLEVVRLLFEVSERRLIQYNSDISSREFELVQAIKSLKRGKGVPRSAEEKIQLLEILWGPVSKRITKNATTSYLSIWRVFEEAILRLYDSNGETTMAKYFMSRYPTFEKRFSLTGQSAMRYEGEIMLNLEGAQQVCGILSRIESLSISYRHWSMDGFLYFLNELGNHGTIQNISLMLPDALFRESRVPALSLKKAFGEKSKLRLKCLRFEATWGADCHDASFDAVHQATTSAIPCTERLMLCDFVISESTLLGEFLSNFSLTTLSLDGLELVNAQEDLNGFHIQRSCRLECLEIQTNDSSPPKWYSDLIALGGKIPSLRRLCCSCSCLGCEDIVDWTCHGASHTLDVLPGSANISELTLAHLKLDIKCLKQFLENNNSLQTLNLYKTETDEEFKAALDKCILAVLQAGHTALSRVVTSGNMLHEGDQYLTILRDAEDMASDDEYAILYYTELNRLGRGRLRRDEVLSMEEFVGLLEWNSVETVFARESRRKGYQSHHLLQFGLLLEKPDAWCNVHII